MEENEDKNPPAGGEEDKEEVMPQPIYDEETERENSDGFVVQEDEKDDKETEESGEAEIFEEIHDPNIGTLKPRDLVTEMETSYLDYAMSVIVSRALPDVRDGLKPVHRRVVYAMHDTGLKHSAHYRKSAKVVGEVIGNYHPHGDIAVYDTLVRMAQDFSMRYQLVDGQGNFGSMDGDSAAAMRYTECRMTSIAEEMVADIEKDTVDWQENYDGSTKEPKVLPARVPQLLLNGAMGIAVGMATNIPPHNLKELCDGIIHLIENPDATIDEMMKFVKGPDFPTGANIYNNEDIKIAYATGKGKIMMRAKADIEETKRGFRIIITEIPYQVNKASLIEKTAELVKTKKIDGISDIRDESDRHGIRVVIELRGNSYPKKVLNRLYELTQMQTAFHVNMLALTPDLEPRIMTLIDVCKYYIVHRQEVIERRTKYDLKKAEERAHILEGLKIALDNIDEVIAIIKKSESRDSAQKNLMSKFSLSVAQSNAILDMRLSQLAALERKKIEDEYDEVLKMIAYLKDLLDHPEKILDLIKDDLKDVSKKYGDPRRTEIIPHALGEFRAEDLIPDEQVIVAVSRGNYIKRQDIGTYRKQTRGGVGITGMTTKEEDIVDHLVCANTHDDVYFFTDRGRVFKSKVYEIPSTSRLSKGTPVVNVILLGQSEKVTAMLMVPKDQGGSGYFVMGTSGGQIKKTEIKQYENIRKTGIIAMGLKNNDQLKWVKISSGSDVVIEVTEEGQAICYHENDVRPMGRSASGVTGMRLKGNDKVMVMDIISEKYFKEKAADMADMLVVLQNGFGKRTKVNMFHIQKRGGYGMRAASCTTRTGHIIGMHITYSEDPDVVIASQKGQFIRLELSKIKRLGRDTQGVTLMRLRQGDKVSSVALIRKNDNDITENGESNLPPISSNGENPEEKERVKEGDAVEDKESEAEQQSLKVIGADKNGDDSYAVPEFTIHTYTKNSNKEKEMEDEGGFKHKKINLSDTKLNGHSLLKKPDNLPAAKIEDELMISPNDEPILKSDLNVKPYSDKVIVSKEEKADQSVDKNGRKNSPIQKDKVNYWGKKVI